MNEAEADGPTSGVQGGRAPSWAAADTRAGQNRRPGGTEPGEPAFGTRSSVLEARYRRLLRILPRPYRDVREEEMVGTFLAAMYDEDPENYDLTLKQGSPSGTEMRAVAALAIRLRWGRTVAPERYAARTLAWRMVLFTGVTIMWAFSVAQLIGIGLAFVIDPVPVDSPAITDIYREMLALPAGSWVWWSAWAYLGWTVTLPLLVFGGRAGARWAAACAAVPVVTAAIAWARDGVTSGIHIAETLGLAVDVGLVGLLVAYAARPDAPHEAGLGIATHPIRRSPDRRPRVFLIAGASMVLVLTASAAAIWLVPDLWPSAGVGRTLLESIGWLISFDAGRWTLAAVTWGIGMLVRRRRRADPVRAAGWAAGCASIAGVATVLSAAWALDFARSNVGMDAFGWTFTVTNAAQMAVAAGVLVISAVIAARRIRALPRGQYAAAHRVADAEH